MLSFAYVAFICHLLLFPLQNGGVRPQSCIVSTAEWRGQAVVLYCFYCRMEGSGRSLVLFLLQNGGVRP